MPKEWKKNKPPASVSSEPVEPFGSELLAAEVNADAPQVDLHGMREDEARGEVERFVNAQFVAGNRFARVIHGKGGGHLRRETHVILAVYKARGVVANYRDALHAVGGVTVFALHPNE